MRLLRRLAALAAVLVLGLVFAPGAVAGGPTSVLLVSPSTGETASLYASDSKYTALQEQLGGGFEQPRGEAKPPAGLELDDQPRQINVTWMAHDVEPWRWDRVYLGSDRVVWIHSTVKHSDGDTRSGAGAWHRAEDPRALTALLRSLGVSTEKTATDKGGITPVAPTFEPPPAENEPPPAANEKQAGAGEPLKATETAVASSDATTNWWWAIPGLITGAVLTVLLRPLLSRLPRPPFRSPGRRNKEPRAELLDS
ncbi:hypothetical protein ACIBCM_32310 [Streptomyces sp. NPDC051018]|uniref:hypothetical protein n=1 Tax=Streptomyces sp. NPDC051018 TaxID=3365639 RepID=UPI0037A21C30